MNERVEHPRDPVAASHAVDAAGEAARLVAERIAAWARPRLRRLGLRRWAERAADPFVRVGAVLVLGGSVVWILEDTLSLLPQIPADVPLIVVGTALLSGRLSWQHGRLQAAHMAVVQAASARMSRATTIEEIGRTIVEETGRIIDYHNARVYVLEPPDLVVPIAFEGRVGAYERVDLELLRTHLGAGFTGWVAQHGVPLLVNDANRDPRGATIPGTDEVDESMLVVPMRYDERTVGVITLSKLGVDQFTSDDLRLLSILADQAAIALENARLLLQSRSLAAELRRLVDMARELSGSLDPYQVADLIARHLALAAGVDRCEVSYLDRTGDTLITMASFPAGLGPHAETYDLGEYPETRRVIEAHAPVLVDGQDPDADPAERRYLASQGLRAMLMLPLVAKGSSIGLVELASSAPLRLEASTLELISTMANEAAIALENASLYDRARNLADHDPVTGFYNHRYFQQRLGEEILRASRSHRPLSLLMLDLDDFKLVNDTFGHLLGDEVLAWTAQLIRSVVRTSDVPARYGGDEFAVLLPDADREGAMATSARIIAAFREHPFRAEARGPVPIGVSIGVATYPTDALAGTGLIEAADIALYRAKGTGGDSVDAGGPGTAARAGRHARARTAARSRPATRAATNAGRAE
ncbi:MAG TPA: sensor domain-containing diguanylate cyclase [Candidatus Dormibacteraeota bacterium]|nr:sensor domain-containing diguanylate cyclase [Candidatus Dormibacteraeota bacterium]